MGIFVGAEGSGVRSGLCLLQLCDVGLRTSLPSTGEVAMPILERLEVACLAHMDS